MEEKPFPAWSWSIEQCLKELHVKLDKGLSTYEVEKRRERHGWNELAKEKGKPLWRLVLEQFDDTLVKILLVAAFISFVLAFMGGGESGDSGFEAYVEPFVIVLILVLNAIVGVWQESNAEKALEALKQMQSESGKVLRDGYLVPDLPARELVPGDIVELRVGDKVPADMRVVVLKTSTLRVEQSSLTGEAMPVLKNTDPIFMDDCDLQAKENMVFSGTTVVNGSCLCVVISTGMNTEIGKIQKQIHEASLEEDDTPLKKKLDEFGSRFTTAIGFVCLIVWVMNYKNFLSWDLVDGWPTNVRFSFERCTYYFKIAVALAVAAIPEGLPAVITTCLALGTRKMAQKNAIVRKLPSVETLGCTTVICSDKTGTLTTNQMSVTEFFTLGGKTTASRTIRVEGTTYDPKDGGIVDWSCFNMDVNMQAMAEICAVCNDAGIYFDGQLFRSTGLPTEAALKVLVEKMGVPDAKARNKIRDMQLAASYLIDSTAAKLGCCEWWTKRSKRVATLEFDRVRKSMSVIVREPTGRNRLLVKGAVESLLERAFHVQLADGSLVPIDETCKQLLLSRLQEMSSKGLRCLGFAYKEELGEFSDYSSASHPAHKKLLDPACYSSIESDLIFVGIVGLRDPPRDEVGKAIEDCREAGIKVMVITGDNKSTAEAICQEIRLLSKDEDMKGRSFTGKEFMVLPQSQQKEVLSKPGGKVFSRAEPRHKQEIVRMLKEMGEIVAMTGDGVNDAPALKLADIGIAMGITGTEVAKEASDMVLADDNFSTIVSAVAEGRAIYTNMKAFIRYMISSNVGEVISIFLTAALGIPECMIPVQLLWVNLVTDGPPATALGFNPADIHIMKKPPRKSNDPLMSSWVLFRYLVIGSYVGIATVGIFVLWCPKCVQLKLPRDAAAFCTQDCFKASWNSHKSVHLKAKSSEAGSGTPEEEGWLYCLRKGQARTAKLPYFDWTGALRPYPISSKRIVPAHIDLPDWASDGIPKAEPNSDLQCVVEIKTADQIERMRETCRIAREVLDAAARVIRPGITTDEIDRVVHEATIAAGGYPSPLNYHFFPKSCCTSVNEVICHGIPDARKLEDGDIINVDVTVYYKGVHGDLNETYFVGNVDEESQRLVQSTYESMEKAISIVKPGMRFREVGEVINRHVTMSGFSVVKSICGHGIGELFHCAPNIPHYTRNKAVGVMKAGQTFTIEPMINAGVWRDRMWPDGWTVVTADGKRSAQFEHTLLVTETGVEVLTARLPSSPKVLPWLNA